MNKLKKTMNKLIEIKKIRAGRQGGLGEKFTEEEYIEIALSWLKGEITFTQISKGLNIQGSNVYNFLARGMKFAFKNGVIKTK